jgi:addiction module HigA family antidote
MHNPPHPGEILREFCLDPLNLTVTQAADALGVSRKTLSSILNGHSGISAEMAIRLSIAFNTTAESWLLQQVQYDLSRVVSVNANYFKSRRSQQHDFSCFRYVGGENGRLHSMGIMLALTSLSRSGKQSPRCLRIHPG